MATAAEGVYKYLNQKVQGDEIVVLIVEFKISGGFGRGTKIPRKCAADLQFEVGPTLLPARMRENLWRYVDPDVLRLIVGGG